MSHTPQPRVSASVTSFSKFPGCRPMKSTKITGCLAFRMTSAMVPRVAGSAPIGAGAFCISSGGISRSSQVSFSSCSQAS